MINPPSTNFAEQWVKQYAQLNKAISYKSFDFNGIKRSLIEYLRTYHPEYFNNLTETDELLPLIEMFAYVGELYAYRADVNSQEHILATATRKSSAIQIANMLGYTPSRRVGGIGLVKITSVSTTESINDVSGSNLQRRVIKWGDPTNPRWKSQFELVMGRVLNTSVGISAASDKTQVDNITFERHVMNTSPLINGVFKYNIVVNGVSVPMELVSTALESGSITEQRPIGVRPLDLLYANDGFGDASPTSGYMFLTKQGTLSSQLTSFDGGTVNLTFTGSAVGINDTDVWLNAVNADRTFKSNWLSVDNIAYNDNTSGDVFQIVSLENDQVTLVFGDGNYANVPVGNFEMWHRVSMELENPIPVSAINNQQFAVEYLDIYGNTQTFSCTFTLSSPIVNGSASESLDKLKQSIPGVFYTQDRMVNANDHQTYLLQDPSIVKVKAVNRTFAGHSKYSGWYDSGEVYENVKIFSDDGVVYFEPTVQYKFINTSMTGAEFVTQQLESSLLYPELWTAISYKTNTDLTSYRTYFSPDVQTALINKTKTDAIGNIISLQWSIDTNDWIVGGENSNADLFFIRGNARLNSSGVPELIDTSPGWTVFSNTYKLILQSSTTRFWQYSSLTTQDYDTLHPTNDTITILKANLNKSRTSNMSVDTLLKISNNVSFMTTLSNQASKDLSRVELTDSSINIGIRGMINTEHSVLCPTDTALTIKLPQSFVVSTTNSGYADIISVVGYIFDATGNVISATTFAVEDLPVITHKAGTLSYTINLPSLTYNGTTLTPGVDSVVVTMRDYVYFDRPSEDYPFVPLATTDAAKLAYAADTSGNICRYMGRDGINFLWQHFTSDFELINPARTNITDLYVIPKQYFTQYMRWLREPSLSKPELPTSAQLHTAYSKYLQKSMMSDELVLRPGKFRPLFGPKSEPTLRAKIQVVVAAGIQIANDAVKQEIVTLTRKYFDISNVDFGDTFYFSNLSSYLHASSKYELGSVLLIPLYPGYKFGDLYELTSSPDEVFVVDINVTDVQIADQLSATQMRQ